MNSDNQSYDTVVYNATNSDLNKEMVEENITSQQDTVVFHATETDLNEKSAVEEKKESASLAPSSPKERSVTVYEATLDQNLNEEISGILHSKINLAEWGVLKKGLLSEVKNLEDDKCHCIHDIIKNMDTLIIEVNQNKKSLTEFRAEILPVVVNAQKELGKCPIWQKLLAQVFDLIINPLRSCFGYSPVLFSDPRKSDPRKKVDDFKAVIEDEAHSFYVR